LGARAASGAGASPADRGALGVIVMLGLFLSNYSSDRAREYWIAMFPVFDVTCLMPELATGRAHVIPLWRILLRQALHWLGPIIAVQFTYLLSGTPYTPPRPPVSI
jgi:hypothetical protein